MFDTKFAELHWWCYSSIKTCIIILKWTDGCIKQYFMHQMALSVEDLGCLRGMGQKKVMAPAVCSGYLTVKGTAR